MSRDSNSAAATQISALARAPPPPARRRAGPWKRPRPVPGARGEAALAPAAGGAARPRGHGRAGLACGRRGPGAHRGSWRGRYSTEDARGPRAGRVWAGITTLRPRTWPLVMR